MAKKKGGGKANAVEQAGSRQMNGAEWPKLWNEKYNSSNKEDIDGENLTKTTYEEKGGDKQKIKIDDNTENEI